MLNRLKKLKKQDQKIEAIKLIRNTINGTYPSADIGLYQAKCIIDILWEDES